MSSYKVALISDWFLPRVGGLELHIRDLARELTARGHQAHIICSTPGPRDSDGVPVHRLPVPLLPLYRTIRSGEALSALKALLRRERFDIVHAHTALSPLALMGTYAAHQLRIPSLLTEHSVLRERGITLLRALNHLYPFTTWPTLFTAVSNFVAEDVRRIIGRDEVFVVLNATRLSDWQSAKALTTQAADDGVLPVASVGRMTKRKRPVDLIRMIPGLLALLPASLRIKFTLVGDGPERRRVEREIRRLGVGEYVELLGMRPRNEIKEILSRSAVFALPCYMEAMSIATLEARACGLPVVARTPNGVAEVIDHGVHGFLAASDDEFIRYLARLLLDPALRQRMSEVTRRGLERFSWDGAIERHLELYALATQRCGEVRRVTSAQEDVAVSRLRPRIGLRA